MQISPPISDVSVGLWTPTPIYSRIDELTFDDSDYVTSGADPDVNSFVVKLKPLAWPVKGAQTLKVRFKKTDDGAPVLVQLLQGDISIHSNLYKATTIGTSFSTVMLTLSDEEITLINDYTNLRVKVTAGGPEPCCNREMPLKLTATITNVSGCSELSGVSVPLNFEFANEIQATWLGFTNVCGSVLHVRFNCFQESPNNFTIGPNGWGVYRSHPTSCRTPFSGLLQPGATCDPVYAVFSEGPLTILSLCGCCANNKNVTFDIVVTE